MWLSYQSRHSYRLSFLSAWMGIQQRAQPGDLCSDRAAGKAWQLSQEAARAGRRKQFKRKCKVNFSSSGITVSCYNVYVVKLFVSAGTDWKHIMIFVVLWVKPNSEMVSTGLGSAQWGQQQRKSHAAGDWRPKGTVKHPENRWRSQRECAFGGKGSYKTLWEITKSTPTPWPSTSMKMSEWLAKGWRRS